MSCHFSIKWVTNVQSCYALELSSITERNACGRTVNCMYSKTDVLLFPVPLNLKLCFLARTRICFNSYRLAHAHTPQPAAGVTESVFMVSKMLIGCVIRHIFASTNAIAGSRYFINKPRILQSSIPRRLGKVPQPGNRIYVEPCMAEMGSGSRCVEGVLKVWEGIRIPEKCWPRYLDLLIDRLLPERNVRTTYSGFANGRQEVRLMMTRCWRITMCFTCSRIMRFLLGAVCIVSQAARHWKDTVDLESPIVLDFVSRLQLDGWLYCVLF